MLACEGEIVVAVVTRSTYGNALDGNKKSLLFIEILILKVCSIGVKCGVINRGYSGDFRIHNLVGRILELVGAIVKILFAGYSYGLTNLKVCTAGAVYVDTATIKSVYVITVVSCAVALGKDTGYDTIHNENGAILCCKIFSKGSYFELWNFVIVSQSFGVACLVSDNSGKGVESVYVYVFINFLNVDGNGSIAIVNYSNGLGTFSNGCSPSYGIGAIFVTEGRSTSEIGWSFRFCISIEREQIFFSCVKTG